MCGIAGLINYERRDRGTVGAILSRMTDAIAHRGPDGDGFCIDDTAMVGFGHRRLAIIDLSETGAQPMTSASGRYTITYNGEIYGFLELRHELEERGARFRGTSDTEVLLAAVEAFGFEAAIQRLNGMFAFALHDKLARKVIFARDRLGKKPLYIGVTKGTLVFGSELKSLRAHPEFARPELDYEAVSLFLRHHYIPAPYTILRNVTKLLPEAGPSRPSTRQLLRSRPFAKGPGLIGRHAKSPKKARPGRLPTRTRPLSSSMKSSRPRSATEWCRTFRSAHSSPVELIRRLLRP